MNALSYALLAMVARKPCTGYELAKLLEIFWQAKHSQIYPLLTKMEQQNYLTFEYIEQAGKPDKKIYSITKKGKQALQQWMYQAPAEPVIRDEFLTKVYAIWLTDVATARKLFQERIIKYEKKIRDREGAIREMEETFGESIKQATSPQFGRYLLFMRKLKQEKDEIEWCQWALSLLDK